MEGVDPNNRAPGAERSAPSDGSPRAPTVHRGRSASVRSGAVELKLAENGVWYVHWSEGGRSRRRTTGERGRAEAEAFLANFILERAVTKNPQGDMTVLAVLDDYWHEHACKVESAERIHIIIRHLAEHFGADVMASELSRPVVDGYYRARAAQGIGAGTIRREAGSLVAAINHAARERRLDRNLIPHIALPAEPPAKDRWLRSEEVAALRAACGPVDSSLDSLRIRVFFEIALNTAARKRSIETLSWLQVNFDGRLIDFNPAGRRQTAKRRARVPIADELMPWLRMAHVQWGSTGWVLGQSNRLADRFEAAVRRAGLWSADRAVNVSPHTVRHTAATHMAQAGVSLWDIAGVLGDTLATVEKKYAHHHPDYLRSAVNFRERAK